MKKYLAVVALLFGYAGLACAGTPQETFFQGQAPLSSTSILASTASTVGTATLTLTVSTPTAINSGGATFSGRNCFTRFLVQIATYTTVTIADNNTTKWTIYGAGIGTTGTNTLAIPEDHLGPWCTGSGNQTLITITPTNGLAGNPQAVNVEGYVRYGGTEDSGPMF